MRRPNPAAESSAYSDGFLLAGCAAIVAIAAAGISRAWINHDAAWYLYAARAWLNGAVLYRDIVDPNPPLVIFLMAIPLGIAHLCRAPVPATFKTVIFIAALASTAAAGVVLKRTPLSVTSRRLVTSALLFLLLPMAGADFGQREHIASLLVVPYVAALIAAVTGRPLSGKNEWTLGLLAGVGLALKPHFLLAWLGAEAGTIAMTGESRRMRRRPGACGVVTTLALYALGVIVLAPRFFPAARDAAAVYGGLDGARSVLLGLTELRVWPVTLLAVLFLPVPAPFRKGSLLIFVVATGFLLAAVLQFKGWGYHLYPFRVFTGWYAVVVMGAFADAHARRAPDLSRVRSVVAVVLVIGLVLVTWRDRRKLFAPSGIEQVTTLHELVASRGAESIAVLSMRTIVFPAFPVVNYTQTAWIMRHNSLWFLPGLYGTEPRDTNGRVAHRRLDQMSVLERKYFEQVVGDLCARPPDLLIVEPPAPADRGYGAIDLLAYYRQDEGFARLAAAYEPGRTFGPFRVFERTRTASCGGVAGAAASRH